MINNVISEIQYKEEKVKRDIMEHISLTRVQFRYLNLLAVTK